MLPYIEINPQDYSPKASVILMHGLGADGHDFEDIVKELNLPENNPTRFIFPHAPIITVTINNGFMMRAWFDIKEINLNSKEDEVGIYEAEKMISELIENENKKGIPYQKIILAGFSQGAALAIYTGLRYPKKLGGILSLSGYLPLRDKLIKETNPINLSIPIMMAHGIMDSIIPISIAQLMKDVLVNLGYEVEFKKYSMDHSVCMSEINDISNWLQRIIKTDIG